PSTPTHDTLSLHDALPIYQRCKQRSGQRPGAERLADPPAAGGRPGAASLCGKTLPYEGTPPRELTPRAPLLNTLRPITGHVRARSEEHTSELQSRGHLVCR